MNFLKVLGKQISIFCFFGFSLIGFVSFIVVEEVFMATWQVVVCLIVFGGIAGYFSYKK